MRLAAIRRDALSVQGCVVFPITRWSSEAIRFLVQHFAGPDGVRTELSGGDACWVW